MQEEWLTMSEQSLDVSPSGFRFPYHRFLADIAAGVFAILLFMLASHVRVEPPWRLGILRQITNDVIDADEKIFLMILLGVAAVPIGLILNGLGWFVFGGLQRRGTRFWFRHHKRGISLSTGKAYRLDLLEKFFDLDADNLYSRAKFFEGTIEARWPIYLHDYRHVLGLKTLIRSAALLALITVVIIVAFLPCWWRYWPVLLVCILGLLLSCITLTLLEYYLCLAVLFRTLHLTGDSQASVADPREKVVVDRVLPSLRDGITLLQPSRGSAISAESR